MGNRGAHSWKNMLIIWSETRRGGVFVTATFGGEALGDEVGDLHAAKKTFVSKLEQGLPLSWTLVLKVSRLFSTLNNN